MTCSYSQISQYLACPRRYRHRYLDGWQERDTRAAMVFGRVFEKALSAYFLHEDSAAVLFQEWGVYRDAKLEYSPNDTWDRMAQQGVQLLERFCQEDRVQVRQPRRNLQVKLTRKLSNGNNFVAYVDALGSLDGTRCLLEWKTTGSCYPEAPADLVALDPQLICYSWITGISEVAMVVFVRKRLVQIQYLRATVSDEQRAEFEQLVVDSVGRIESGRFLPHTGIRFPQNGCVSCPHLGLCLHHQDLIDSKLVRRPGASDLDWLDQLDG